MPVYKNKWAEKSSCACDCGDRWMIVHVIGECATDGNPDLYVMCDCEPCVCVCHLQVPCCEGLNPSQMCHACLEDLEED